MTDQNKTALNVPTNALPRHFIFRPRSRLIWLQLLLPLLILSGLSAASLFFGSTLRVAERTFSYALMAACGGVAVAHAIWFCRSAPRVVVACDEFLGITGHSGQQRIPWSSICLAQHSIKHLGMQWELDLIPSGRVILRDIGIAPERWGILRAIIIHCAGANGASVVVDPISETVYPGQ